MWGLIRGTILLVATTVSPRAEHVSCQTGGVIVDAPEASQAALVCDAVNQAQTVLLECGLPAIDGPVRVDIVEDLPPGCLAIYHCRENWIEILAPPNLGARRVRDGAFGFLDPASYFRSVVVHELTHVLFDTVPCPFEACIAADEYVAYTLQVMSLSSEQQNAFEDRAGLDREISRDELNALYLFMAPDRFAQKAWAHVSQRQDACAYLGQIIDGAILFDRDRF